MRLHTLCLVDSQFRHQQRTVIMANNVKASIGCSVLGKGLLPSLDYAAQRLITPGARVVPAAIQVKSCVDVQRYFSLVLRPQIAKMQKPLKP